ncbi:hypothetical protein [Novosphingobium resinovorum]|uniref:hypothetical protein n=1 Tax=Novosphingobium resinovorum TaxID=158500 RepID=UPI003DA71F0E
MMAALPPEAACYEMRAYVFLIVKALVLFSEPKAIVFPNPACRAYGGVIITLAAALLVVPAGATKRSALSVAIAHIVSIIDSHWGRPYCWLKREASAVMTLPDAPPRSGVGQIGQCARFDNQHIASHGIASAIASRIVTVIIDFDQREDRARRPILRDEINDFLRERVAIGVTGFSQWVCGGLEQSTHRHLRVNAAMGQGPFQSDQHRSLTFGQEGSSNRAS